MAEQTVTYNIAAAANDSTVSITDGTGALVFTQGLYSGRFNTAAYYGHLRFPGVAIPNGAYIKSAVLTVGVYQKAATAGTYGNVKGIAADNVASIPNSQANASNPNYRASLTTASTPVGNPAANAPVSFDVTAQVAEIVNRAGWSSGNGLGLMFEPTNATQYIALDAYEDNVVPPKLVITFDTVKPLAQRLKDFALWVGQEIKRLDARITAIASGGATNNWPVVVASVFWDYISQQANMQQIPNTNFTKVLLPTKNVDTHNAYDPATSTFTVPVGQAGYYDISAKVRYMDSTVNGVSYGIGMGNTLGDAAYFAWGQGFGSRNGLANQRTVYLAEGAQIFLYTYQQRGQSAPIQQAEMSIFRIK